MTIKTQLLIGLPLLAIAFPVGYMLALYMHEVKVPPETLYERVMEAQKEPIKEPESQPIKEIVPLIPKVKMWNYCFPDYKIGKAECIEASSLEEARKQAEFMGLGTKEVLSTWRQ